MPGDAVLGDTVRVHWRVRIVWLTKMPHEHVQVSTVGRVLGGVVWVWSMTHLKAGSDLFLSSLGILWESTHSLTHSLTLLTYQ